MAICFFYNDRDIPYDYRPGIRRRAEIEGGAIPARPSATSLLQLALRETGWKYLAAVRTSTLADAERARNQVRSPREMVPRPFQLADAVVPAHHGVQTSEYEVSSKRGFDSDRGGFAGRESHRIRSRPDPSAISNAERSRN